MLNTLSIGYFERQRDIAWSREIGANAVVAAVSAAS